MMNLFRKILYFLTKKIISKYNPIVIGITGSVGKTTTKEMVYSVLSTKFNVGKTRQNFNNEIGVPLTVLTADLDIDYKKSDLTIFFWLKVLLHAIFLILFKSQNYPQYLVIEMGADHKGDIKYLCEMVNPKIGIITTIGDIPSHIQNYDSIEELINEKSNLVKAIPNDGLVVLNFDDKNVINMKDYTLADILTYGFDPLSHFRALNLRHFVDGDTIGLEFDLHYHTNRQLVRLPNLIAKYQVYPALIAIVIGVYFNIDITTILNAIVNVQIPDHRMQLKNGINNSLIIDDCYNASVLSMKGAIDALNDLFIYYNRSKGRRIAVLGDMLELGNFEELAHIMIGEYLDGKVDILITIGKRAKKISEVASKFLSKENIYHFDDNKNEVVSLLKNIINKDDIVLLKASRAMQFDLILDEIV